MTATREHSGVVHETTSWSDIYRGRIAALVKAGIVRADQVPGSSHLPDRMSALFIGGVLQRKGKVMPSSDCLRVIRTGDRLLVHVVASKAEQQRRVAQEATDRCAVAARAAKRHRALDLIISSTRLVADLAVFATLESDVHLGCYVEAHAADRLDAVSRESHEFRLLYKNYLVAAIKERALAAWTQAGADIARARLRAKATTFRRSKGRPR
jgi:hypothetical protein